jgi:hypothetical protein
MKGFDHRTFLLMKGIRKPNHRGRLPPIKKGIKKYSFIEAGEFE